MNEAELKNHLGKVSTDIRQFEIDIVDQCLSDLANDCRIFHKEFGSDVENLTYEQLANDIELYCAFEVLSRIDSLYEDDPKGEEH